MTEGHQVCNLELQIAVLEQKVSSSDKALEIAKQAVDRALNVSDKKKELDWSHIFSVISIIVSLSALGILLFKK